MLLSFFENHLFENHLLASLHQTKSQCFMFGLGCCCCCRRRDDSREDQGDSEEEDSEEEDDEEDPADSRDAPDPRDCVIS